MRKEEAAGRAEKTRHDFRVFGRFSMKSKKILVLGAGGMLGHKLMQRLPEEHDVAGTVRKAAEYYDPYKIFRNDRLIGGIDAADFDSVRSVFERIRPQFVINCIGVIKQVEAVNDPQTAIAINALFPHRLADLCRSRQARLIHISTDCVFSGGRGLYRESDDSDAKDLYGRTKFLGEVSGPNCLTLRTSIIGRELESHNGLMEWLILSDGKEVHGYRRTIYSGLTTIAFTRVLKSIIEAPREINGIYHVSSDPINKHDLLLLARDAFRLRVDIVPSDTPVIDRSLDSASFRKTMNYCPPSWQSMISELAADPTPYRSWHDRT
jgi:dTDP-4-dehydrorhamnose reductase